MQTARQSNNDCDGCNSNDNDDDDDGMLNDETCSVDVVGTRSVGNCWKSSSNDDNGTTGDDWLVTSIDRSAQTAENVSHIDVGLL